MRSFLPTMIVAFCVVRAVLFPIGARAQDASPAAELGPPGVAECQITPRSESEIAMLEGVGGSPVSGASEVDETEPMVLPDGEPVDDATRDAIERTLREVVACAQAGDLARLLALYSDAAVERLVLAAEPVPIVPGQPDSGVSGVSATPVASADRTPVVGDARLLPDGQVAAEVSSVAPDSQRDVVLFVQAPSGDRWLIDEIHPLLVSAATPASGLDDPIVQVVLADAASRLGVPIDQLVVVSAEATEWSDSSLGCPREGEFYAQVITPGYQIILEGAGQQLDYRTDTNGNFLVCEGAS
jgi:hypothetical protein